MKYIKFSLLLALVFVTSCDLDPGYTAYSNVPVFIDSKSIPSGGIKDQPLIIFAHCWAPNGCWSDLGFVFSKQQDDFRYELFALGDYTSYGSCPDILVEADTALSFTPGAAGQYIIQVWLDSYNFDLDTIVVTESGSR